MIGIFDSGIGGLTVAKEIFKMYPEYSIIYLGDTARVPYGTKSKEAIIKYSIENTEFLLKKGASIIVVACNSASSNALPSLKKQFPTVQFANVVEPAVKRAVLITKNKRIGVIGTPATIASHIYKKKIKQKFLNKKVSVAEKSCPLFVPLAEEGWTNTRETRLVALKYLEQMPKTGIDTLILACTHYPLLKKVINGIMGKKVKLVDSAIETAKELQVVINKNPALLEKQKKPLRKVFVTDRPYNIEKICSGLLKLKIKAEKIQIT